MTRLGFYEYASPVRVVSGMQALDRLPELLAQLGAARPLVVTDKGVRAAGLVDLLTGVLGDRVAVGGVADEVPPDSSVAAVREVARQYREAGCDAILAVGGGSVLDTSKGVNILVTEGSDDLMAFSGAGALKRRLKPLIAVPTTSGTGSETTLVAVIKDAARQVKMTFVSHYLIPDAAVLDPRMTLTLPPHITAATAMDALTHAMEAYTCLAKNPQSDAAALAAVALIARHLPQVMANPGDARGRLALANAATLAGMAFSNSMCGMVHNLGHAVGAVCGVPHGACMAIFLPYGLEYNVHKNGPITGELLLPLAGEEVFVRTPAYQRPFRVVEIVRQLNRRLRELTGGRHACRLQELRGAGGEPQVPRERFPEIVGAAMRDGASIFNPEDLDREDVLMVLTQAWEGLPLDRTRVRRG